MSEEKGKLSRGTHHPTQKRGEETGIKEEAAKQKKPNKKKNEEGENNTPHSQPAACSLRE